MFPSVHAAPGLKRFIYEGLFLAVTLQISQSSPAPMALAGRQLQGAASWNGVSCVEQRFPQRTRLCRCSRLLQLHLGSTGSECCFLFPYGCSLWDILLHASSQCVVLRVTHPGCCVWDLPAEMLMGSALTSFAWSQHSRHLVLHLAKLDKHCSAGLLRQTR